MANNYRRIFWAINGFIFFLFSCGFYLNSAGKANSVSITAEAAILVDLNRNKILYSKNIHNRLAPASTEKLLTAIVALEKLGPESKVKVSRKASSIEPTKLYIDEGTVFNSAELINAILISSANDASIAVAEAAAGSEAEFAQLMNSKAVSLGTRNSCFLNASGLPQKGQYSTAYDLYKIVNAALQNPAIYRIMQKKNERIKGDGGQPILLTNHNKLLFRLSYPLVLGKTGYTKKGRHCYAGIAYYKNKRYAVVILKSNKPWSDIKRLLACVR